MEREYNAGTGTAGRPECGERRLEPPPPDSSPQESPRALRTVQIDLGSPVSLQATLECGQAFRWRRTSFPGRPDLAVAYRGVMPVAVASVRSQARRSVEAQVSEEAEVLGEVPGRAGRSLAMIVGQDCQVTDRLTIAYDPGFASEAGVKHAALRYFSADDEVAAIERELSRKDPAMAEGIPFSHGLRILRQDPWECLASYVLSVNNSIPNIGRIVERLARCLGDEAGLGEQAFPSPEKVACQESEFLRQSKCGFRDRYLKDAAERVCAGEVDLGALARMPTEQACERLMRIRGVGPKVADCVLLFAYHRLEVFPVDVWIARAMSQFYLGGLRATPKAAREEGIRRFGAFAGYAQEHLFYRVRSSGRSHVNLLQGYHAAQRESHTR